MRRTVRFAGLLGLALTPHTGRGARPATSPDARYRLGATLFADSFRYGLAQWTVELERPGKVRARGGTLDIDVPAGATLWFRHPLDGPVLIRYRATAVRQGGRNDRVSDLNCFWMASNAAPPLNPIATPRRGAFATYNTLLTYYVGLGGNGDTTTRFRRYIGSRTDRPLRPQDDLSATDTLLVPNREDTIELVADGHLIQYFRNGRKLFELYDPNPYTAGWFALRTTQNHMRVRDLQIIRLSPSA